MWKARWLLMLWVRDASRTATADASSSSYSSSFDARSYTAHTCSRRGMYGVSYVCEASCGVVRATPPGFEHRAHRAVVDDGELGAARRHVEGAHGRRVLDERDGERIVDEELEDLWRQRWWWWRWWWRWWWWRWW